MAISEKRFMSPVEKQYLMSGEWKCPESPSGAHWWDCNTKPAVCKICNKIGKVAAQASTTFPAKAGILRIAGED